MLNTQDENIVTLSEATNLIPSLNGRRLHPSTLWRWCRRGLAGTRLEYIRVGRRICTSEEALGRFFNSLADRDIENLSLEVPPSSLDKEQTSRVRQAQIRDANRTLDSRGL